MSVLVPRFMADESCDFAVVRVLRGAGYDILAISEIMQRSKDPDLVVQAAQEQRILLTEDKDFGWLVFVSQLDSAGVILIRYPATARATLAQTILKLAQERGASLYGLFVVVQPGHIRLSRRPS